MRVRLKRGKYKYPNENTYIFSGGLWYNYSWDEYLSFWNDKEKIIKIKEYILKRGLVGKTGEWQNDRYFKFSDGEIWSFTWRAWGDLMQSIVNKREGYMKYYM